MADNYKGGVFRVESPKGVDVNNIPPPAVPPSHLRGLPSVAGKTDEELRKQLEKIASFKFGPFKNTKPAKVALFPADDDHRSDGTGVAWSSYDAFIDDAIQIVHSHTDKAVAQTAAPTSDEQERALYEKLCEWADRTDKEYSWSEVDNWIFTFGNYARDELIRLEAKYGRRGAQLQEESKT